jgi:hypothetical protein
VFQKTVVLDGYDQVTDLLGDGYQVLHQARRTPDGVAASIPSRWPIAKVRQEILRVTPRVPADEPWIGSGSSVRRGGGPGRVAFQVADRAGDRGLRDHQPFCGVAEAALLRDRDEDRQVPQLRRHPVWRTSTPPITAVC